MDDITRTLGPTPAPIDYDCAPSSLKYVRDAPAGTRNVDGPGARQRYWTAKAVTADLTKTELRVFLALLDRTMTYAKAFDYTSTRQIAEIVYGVPRDDVQPWQRRRVSNACVALRAKLGMVYEPGSGLWSRALIGFPEGEQNQIPEGEQNQIRDPSESPLGEQDQTPLPDNGASHPGEGEQVCTEGEQNQTRKVSEPAATPNDLPADSSCGFIPLAAEIAISARAERILKTARSRARFPNQKERVKDWDLERTEGLIAGFANPLEISDDQFVGWMVDGSNTLSTHARATA